MDVRKATKEYIDDIMKLIQEAKLYLKEQGIDQWQNGSPDEALILSDLLKEQGYLFIEGEDVIAYMALCFGKDESYDKVYDGEWVCKDALYGTIHRTAISSKYRGKGMAKQLFEAAEVMAKQAKMQTMRIDTHPDNELMKHLILREGYLACGYIILKQDGTKRLAYEKVL